LPVATPGAFMLARMTMPDWFTGLGSACTLNSVAVSSW
jgi:hypothetical protein